MADDMIRTDSPPIDRVQLSGTYNGVKQMSCVILESSSCLRGQLIESGGGIGSAEGM